MRGVVVAISGRLSTSSEASARARGVIGVQGVADANYGTDRARGVPKARLRGEKSLAFDGANHRCRRERPQEKLADPRRQSLARWNRPNRSSRDGGYGVSRKARPRS